MQLNGKDINVPWESYQFGTKHKGDVTVDVVGTVIVHTGASPRVWSGLFEVYSNPPANYVTLADIAAMYSLPKLTFTDHTGSTYQVIWDARPVVTWDAKSAQLGHVQFMFEEIV